MDIRLISAVTASKALKLVIRTFGGGATTAPGLLAEYIDPLSLKKLAKYYEHTLIVTGTNGKTTTARLLGSILNCAKTTFIHNRSGSNLLRGVIGTMVDNVTFTRGKRISALLEVDELTLSTVVNQTNPKVLVFNNLFRDQLDRYGEVEKIRKIWMRALAQLDKNNILVLNSDDHSVSHLGSVGGAKVIYFGIEDKALSLGKLPHASDFTSCIVCGGKLDYDEIYLAHLGRYRCASCKLTRPKPDVYAEKIYLDETRGFKATIVTPKGRLEVKIKMPGLYNVYNSLAAISAALALKIDLETIKKGLEQANPAFGRTEKLTIDGKSLFIGLVKNPAGFNEILRTIFRKDEKKYALFAINDLIADGRDVSWLWDVDFELYIKKIRRLWVSGIRASEMGLRIKYTGAHLPIEIEEDLAKALEKAIDGLPSGETLYILPTYTAMLKIKKILAGIGVSSNFWED